MEESGDDELVRAVVAALPRIERLRHIARALGLSSAGPKALLIGRLTGALQACPRRLERVLLDALSRAELRTVCLRLGLHSSGSRDDLTRCLLTRLGAGARAALEEDEEPGAFSFDGDDEPHSVPSVLAALLGTLPGPRLRELARSLGLPCRSPGELLAPQVALGVESDPASITRFLGGLRAGELRACAERVGIPSTGDAHVLALRLSAWLDLFRPEPPTARRGSPRSLLLGRWRLGPARFAVVAGTVHDAVDVLLPARVGCRAIVAHVPSDRGLQAEVEIGLGLEGAGLVRYVDLGVDEDGRDVAIVTDPGTPLCAWLAERGPVPASVATRLTLGLAVALDAAHVRGALHGDLHLEAIWIDVDGVTRLNGFGLRRGRDGAANARDRVRPPRLAWAPPEVARHGVVTAASDQFGLALVFASCVLGRPVDGPATVGEPLGLAPTQLRAVRRALSEATRDRFSNCLDFALALVTP